MKSPRRHFASDNNSGICPEAWEAMQAANAGHVPSYGDDDWTQHASDTLRDLFQRDCEVFFVFNGTAANSLALASICQSYHSIICCDTAHLETDECGGPEFFSNGTKLHAVPSKNGKLDPALVDFMVGRRNDIHYPKPRALSISQSTELGTVYRPAEIHAIAETAKRNNLRVHMDGARFANAAAFLNLPAPQLVEGVDVLCFGGSKNGLAVGEAVVFFNRECAHEFEYRCKQAGQLASKMRFLAAPWWTWIRDGAWLRHAANANRMARLLAHELNAIDEIEILYPCEANAVFASIPAAVRDALLNGGWRFYGFIGACSRLMTSWDTTEEDVASFVSDLKAAMAATANTH